MTVGVLIVDDHELAVLGLRYAFEHDPRFAVRGTATTGLAALAALAELDPQVVVLDRRLPDTDGLEVCRRIRAERPTTGVVVLTNHVGDEALLGALDAGASAYLPKSAPAEQVLEAAAHAAAQPGSFTAEGLAEVLQRRLRAEAVRLSDREKDILTLLSEGRTIAEIARRLYVSESTTRSAATRLYEKLGASNRSQAIMTAVRLGLIRGRASLGGE